MPKPRDRKYQLTRLKGSILQSINRMRSVKAIFHSIYYNHRWGDGESVSGTGSKIDQTRTISARLPEIFRQYRIQHILDIPCGDFNWMASVDLSDVRYSGADIVRPLVEKNIACHSSPGISFSIMDILADDLPPAGLILCRDCFVHFANKHVFKALSNIKRSGAEYLLATTFPLHQNIDIVTGSWRPINLQTEPFFFPSPLELINEGYHKEDSGIADKSLGLWRISELP